MNLSQLKGWDSIIGEILIYLLSPIAFLVNKIIQNFIPSKNSICVLKMVGGGSLLIAYPALLAVRKKYKNTRLLLICTKEVKAYAGLMGIFDEIYVVNTNSFSGLIFSAIYVLGKIKQSQYFLNFEMHSKLCTIYALASLSKQRFGLFQSWNKWQRNYINNPIFYTSHTPIYVGYEQLAEKIHAEPLDWVQASKSFQRVNGFSSHHNSDTNNARIAFAPFCSPLYREREFSADEWVSILSKYLPLNCREIIMIGGIGDTVRAKLIEDILRLYFPSLSIINKVGQTTLAQVIAEFKVVDKLITIDSGINHIARLLQIPIISFWGPSDPMLRLKNINSSIDNNLYHKVSCSPCVHLIDRPPCLGDNICMKIHYGAVKRLNPIWEIK